MAHLFIIHGVFISSRKCLQLEVWERDCNNDFLIQFSFIQFIYFTKVRVVRDIRSCVCTIIILVTNTKCPQKTLFTLLVRLNRKACVRSEHFAIATKCSVKYRNIPSAVRQVSHGDGPPVTQSLNGYELLVDEDGNSTNFL